MNNDDIEKFKNIAKSFKLLNSKIKLIILLEKARKTYDECNYEDCIHNCQKILKKDKTNSVALRGIGCSMQSLGNLKKAEEYYLKALEYSATKEIEYTLLGTLYHRQNKLDEALEYYNKAIDINDDYDLAYEGRNQALLENHLKILDLQDDLIKRKLF